jgi:plastocyanin domain-containing protein
MGSITISRNLAVAFAVLVIAFVVVISITLQNEKGQTATVDKIHEATETVAFQEVYIRAQETGFYDKTEITVKKGIPVRLHFSADNGAGCGKYMAIDEFGVKLISKNEEEMIAEFTPQDAGTYYYHCGMWMFKGKMVVE